MDNIEFSLETRGEPPKKGKTQWTIEPMQDDWFNRMAPGKWYTFEKVYFWLHRLAHKPLFGGWSGWLHNGLGRWWWYEAWGRFIDQHRDQSKHPMVNELAKLIDAEITKEIDDEILKTLEELRNNDDQTT